MRFRSTMLAMALSLGALAAAPTFAAGAKTMSASQQKMATCSHESKGMKGAAHKDFMSKCMKGESTAPVSASTAATAMPNSKMTPQEKMKACNVKAKGLKGTEHKAFMSACLKG